MADLYQAIIGAAPTDVQKQAEIAAQLRRRRSFGELGALTGDRVLQPFGQGMTKQADEYAKLIGENREKGIDDAQTKAYQDAQTAHMKAMEDLTRRGQTLDHIYQMLMAQAAMEKADKTGQPKPARLTYADRTKLENMASEINGADDLMGTFDDKYAQRLGPGPQSKLPNALSAIGLSTPDMDKSANWWAKWKLLYTLPERNRTFGATLTPHEKAAWAEADINPSMDPKTIRDRVSGILKIVKNKGALMNKTYTTQYGADLISDYGLPDESSLIQPQGHSSSPAGAPKRIKVDAQGNVIGN
jgi:hypothetical protein